MSFVRIRKNTSSGLPRKRRIQKKKPAWDDTVQDLTKLKATPEEIEQRKLAHKSKFALASRLEKQHRLNRGAKGNNLSMSNAEARQLAIMKEVLYDQQQFQEVLSKSDKMMDVVKDLFGDDPKRYTGFPNVTSAPGNDDPERSGSIVAPLPDFQTRMEALSDSVMDQSALNDLLNSDSDDGDAPEPITYQPKMNMQRFQQFLAAEEKNNTLSTISGQAHLSHLDHGPVQSTRIQDTQSLQTTRENAFTTPPKKRHDESIEILRSPKSAINDTKKIKKTKPRVNQDSAQHNVTTNNNTSSFQLTDLRKVLEGLENEIVEYERQTGRGPAAEQPRQETFSGYTLSLVDSVTKLTRYLKENDLRLRAEMTVREQLTQDVSQLTSLIDALTSDIIHTQEEYAKLQSDFVRYKQQSHDEIGLLKEALSNAGLLHTPSESTNEERVPSEFLTEEKTTPHSRPELVKPTFYHDEDAPRELNGLPPHLNPESTAILLSPPVRKTRVQGEEDVYQHGSIQGGQSAFVDMARLAGNSHGSNSIPSNTGMTQSAEIPEQSHAVPPSRHPLYTNASAVPSVGIPYHPQRHSMIPQPVYSRGQQPVQAPQVIQHIPPQQFDPRVIAHNDPRVNGLIDPRVNGQNDPRVNGQNDPRVNGQVTGFKTHENDNVSRRLEQNPVVVVSKPLPHNIVQPSAQVNGNRVSVPRPTPLVQSNVGLPLQRGPEQPHPASETGKGGEDRDVLASQIAELNKQHEEAQRRLRTIMQQQPPQGGANNHTTQRPIQENSVSPPISPISQRSENFISIQGMSNQNLNFNPRLGRGITVSLPTVDLSLDSSPEMRLV